MIARDEFLRSAAEHCRRAAGHATGDCLMKLVRLADTFDSMTETRRGAEVGSEGGWRVPQQIG